MSTLEIYAGWDIENCLLPTNYDASNAARDIKSFLEGKGFLGEMELHAVAAKKDRIPVKIQKKFNDLESGVNFYHLFNRRGKNACANELMEQIQLWTTKNPAPAVLMVITGDHGFAKDLIKLKEKDYTIVLVHRRDAGSKDLVGITNHIWIWEDMIPVP